jgi:hypothetical protein
VHELSVGGVCVVKAFGSINMRLRKSGITKCSKPRAHGQANTFISEVEDMEQGLPSFIHAVTVIAVAPVTRIQENIFYGNPNLACGFFEELSPFTLTQTSAFTSSLKQPC